LIEQGAVVAQGVVSLGKVQNRLLKSVSTSRCRPTPTASDALLPVLQAMLHLRQYLIEQGAVVAQGVVSLGKVQNRLLKSVSTSRCRPTLI